jgi:hypothetical protein
MGQEKTGGARDCTAHGRLVSVNACAKTEKTGGACGKPCHTKGCGGGASLSAMSTHRGQWSTTTWSGALWSCPDTATLCMPWLVQTSIHVTAVAPCAAARARDTVGAKAPISITASSHQASARRRRRFKTISKHACQQVINAYGHRGRARVSWRVAPSRVRGL